MVHAVRTAEAEAERRDAQMVVEPGKVAATAEVADLGLVVGVFNQAVAPRGVNAHSVARLAHGAGHVVHQPMERGTPRRAEVASGNRHVLVEVGDRLPLEGVGHGFDPLD